MKKSRALLEMYNNPRLEAMLLTDKVNEKVIREILAERNRTFWDDVSKSAEYHN